jgi:hypothetical protein
MIKLLAVWYASVARPGFNRVDETEDANNIKTLIGKYLYDMGANNLIINYKNELYVIESVNDEKRLYNRRKVSYHPLQHLIGA